MKKIDYAMTKEVIYCNPDNNLAEVGAVMWQHNCGALPVIDNYNNVVSMITDRDICIALTTRNKPASEIKVSEVMSKEFHACRIGDGVEDAIKLMQKAKVRRIPVLDMNKQLKGIITLSDIAMRCEEDGSAAIILKSLYEDVKPLTKAAKK